MTQFRSALTAVALEPLYPTATSVRSLTVVFYSTFVDLKMKPTTRSPIPGPAQGKSTNIVTSQATTNSTTATSGYPAMRSKSTRLSVTTRATSASALVDPRPSRLRTCARSVTCLSADGFGQLLIVPKLNRRSISWIGGVNRLWIFVGIIWCYHDSGFLSELPFSSQSR